MLFFFIGIISCSYLLNNEEKTFISWMRSTNQVYTGDDYQLRLGIFISNLRFIREHNSANQRFTVTANKYAALTPSEYQALLGIRIGHNMPMKTKRLIGKNDDSLDWRDKNVVNPVKDQGQCGSCYAFAAIQAAESAYALSTGTLLRFSEQNVVDCASIVDFCYGCEGGFLYGAYSFFIKRQKGQFILEDDYPYTGVENDCKADDLTLVASISDYININENDENDLLGKVQNGPVAVAIDASHVSFQLYHSGIYDEPQCRSTSLNHGVGCIGYGTEDGVKYWLVRNSWGADWGLEGYIKMVMRDNQCGIASMAVIPIP